MERKMRTFWWATVVIIAAVMLSLPLVIGAQSEAWAGVMAQGNALYEAGDYPGAITKYEEISANGIQNSRVYYNLGNAYFKAGQLGQAIVNYERAAKLAPRDRDIAANLAFAQSQVVDRVDLPEEAALVGWIDRIHNLATLDETLWSAWALYWLIAILAVVAIFVYRTRRVLSYTLVALGIVFGLSLLSLGLKIHNQSVARAVVTTPEVHVYSGPGDDYMLQFTVHEGTRFDVAEQRQGWLRVHIGGNLEGWVSKESLTVI